MVEIEEYASRYGYWLDGNEAHAGTIRALVTQPQMDELGIAGELRKKYQLSEYRKRMQMNKPQLWRCLLAAQLEQELIDAGGIPDEFDAFLIKPQSAIADSSNALFIQGVTPTLERRRITYSQIIILCSAYHSEIASKILCSAANKLYFSISESSDYDDYRGFEAQCRKFLRYMVEISRDKEAYKDVRYKTGIEVYRILP